MPEPVSILAMSALVLGVGLVAAGSVAFRRRLPAARAVSVLLGIVLVLVGTLAATVSVATQGYRALTREELAATVRVLPTGPQRFRATFSFPDGRRSDFELRGDQLYVDAHILKWKPVVNVIGLHTAYELDRVGGRYEQLEAEQDSARTVFSLAKEKPVNLFHLRKRWEFLGPILDAEYGSGTFREVDGPARFDVFVSTSGLLIRLQNRIQLSFPETLFIERPRVWPSGRVFRCRDGAGGDCSTRARA